MKLIPLLSAALLGAANAADRPNVLFLISDDLGAQSLGCYGNSQCKTPNIDALAAQSVKFTRAYCQFPVCGPSRAAIMSGMYPQQNGVTGNGSSDRFTATMGERPSMSEHFKRNGYYSARVSKIYHMRVPGDITANVSGPDHAASWSEFFNCGAPEWMTEGEHEHLSKERLNKDPDKHYGLGFGGAFYVVKGSTDGAEQADHKATAKAVEILEARAKKKDEPFFLAVGFVRPHVPLVAPKSFYEPYPPQTIDVPKVPEGDWDDIPKAGISKNSKGTGIKDDPQKQKILSAYYASVSYMDAQVGKVLGALGRLGMRENTVVVFTADHGYHLGEHDFWQKMGLHDESVRIPILIDAPGKKPGVAHTLAEQIDFYPTLSELAGLPVPEHCKGVSLVPALDDPKATVRDSAYCLRSRDHLLRAGDWAYMRYRDGSEELYDMAKDRGQFTNVIKTAAAAAKAMRGKLDAKIAAIAE